MPRKKIVQDIVPGGQRSIRRISINRDEEEVVVKKSEVIVESIIKATKSNRKGNGSAKYLISFIIIFICVATIGIALSLSYSKAVVSITKKVINLNVDGTFTAKKEATADELSYQVVSISDSLTEKIPAIKGPLIQTKAKGTAIIYNNYSEKSQILVAGTRLMDINNRIYRIVSTVSVPGRKTIPGAVSVNIVADLPGENYNINLAEQKDVLKLPGYKGTDKYAGFYAKFKTDIIGGFSGNKMTIDASLKKERTIAMQSALSDSLITKLKLSIPTDSVLYEKAYTVEYIVSEPIMKSSDQAEITVKGIAYGATFNRDFLIKFIAGKEIKKIPFETYVIDGDRILSFKVSNIKDFSAKKGNPLIFTLKGQVSITGILDENSLKNELRGMKLEQSNAVFAKYTSIANAYALITPFWLRSFPDSVNKINIEYKH
jgi:hypothetical protein